MRIEKSSVLSYNLLVVNLQAILNYQPMLRKYNIDFRFHGDE